MVKHVIVWKLKDEIEDKQGRKEEIKAKLEGLTGKIPGLLEMHIIINGFESSAGDLMMDSVFDSFESLKAYQKNPLHVAVADGIVRPSMQARLSYDYEI